LVQQSLVVHYSDQSAQSLVCRSQRWPWHWQVLLATVTISSKTNLFRCKKKASKEFDEEVAGSE
jgi:hypothetical protein